MAGRSILSVNRPSPLDVLVRARQGLRDRMDAAVDRMLGDDVRRRLDEAGASAAKRGADPFGLDPEAVRYAVVLAQRMYRDYFRVEVTGIENVPDGRVLLISNHSGQLPFDGMAIATAMLLDHDPPRFVRSMVEKWTAQLPFVSVFFPRVGQIVGVPENCRFLLEREEPILVFPEGSRGISKPFSQRYQLEPFGLGFMRLALQTRTPIVPVAVVGAEEQYVSVADLKPLARLLGMPAFPVMPQLLVPGGFMPLPVKYRIRFGAPMTFTGDDDDEDAVIEEKVRKVKSTIQSMINLGLKERPGLFR
ncbi:MAG: lysophospholipid acyltransferase family protein [Polyangiales bacterium]